MSSILTILTFLKKMSAQDLTQAVTMITNLATISNSVHGSDANLEYLQNELFARIRTMVSNNRQNAFRRRTLECIQERSREPPQERPREPPQERPREPPQERPLNTTLACLSYHRTKITLKRNLELPYPHPCMICLEKPKYKDTIETECWHHYCKTCWAGWMTAPTSNQCCPICRAYKPRIAGYRARTCSKRS